MTLKKAKQNNAFLEVFLTWVNTYGTTFQFRIKTRPVIFTVEPEALRLITQDVVNFTKVDHLPNRALYGQRITGTYSILTGGGQVRNILINLLANLFIQYLYQISLQLT